MVQRPQVLAGLDAVLVHERTARGAVELQCLRLAAAAVQGGHLRRDEPLPPGKQRRQRGQVGDDPVVVTEREVRFGSVLERGQAQFVEPSSEPFAQGVVGHVGEQRAAPHGEGLVVQPDPVRGLRRLGGPADEIRERVGVDGMSTEVGAITVADGRHPDAVRREGGPQTADVGVDRAPCGCRRLPLPQQVDQACGAHRAARIEQQDGQQTPLLSADPERYPRSVVVCLEGAEQLQVHGNSELRRWCGMSGEPVVSGPGEALDRQQRLCSKESSCDEQSLP